MIGYGVNDASTPSATQFKIAIEGATLVAQNAADLILIEPGLRPIYGAVLGSRRVFSRFKSYDFTTHQKRLLDILDLTRVDSTQVDFPPANTRFSFQLTFYINSPLILFEYKKRQQQDIQF